MKRLLKHVKKYWFWYLPSFLILGAAVPWPLEGVDVLFSILFIWFVIIGLIRVFVKNSTKNSTQSSNNSEFFFIGRRGGRYRMRMCEKTGRPYRQYF